MSEMQRNQGIIKRLSTPETTAEVYKNLDIDKQWDDVGEDGIPTFIDDDRYDIVNGCIFDVSGAPDDRDGDEEINEAVRLNDTDYRVHAYFYNGGGSFSEMLDESIPKADAEYQSNDDVEKELDDIMEDLITGHNFEYARKALLEWHNKHKAQA